MSNNKGIETLIGLGLLALVGGVAYSSSKKKKFEITRDSNCDDLFQKFNRTITIHPEKKANLQKAHNTIRNKVSRYFEQYTNLPIPEFFIQGSYKMETIIENRRTICDIDLGVFFPRYPGVYADTIQKHLKDALYGHTSQGVTIKKNCVRLNFKRNFHLDLPVYYVDQYSGKTYFGAKGESWKESDPKGFINWFNKATKNKPQLIRIIRYLKAWTDNAKAKTGKVFPSGLAMTLWAIQCYEKSSRDDVAFYNTSSAIMKYLHNRKTWNAMMPVPPGDDVMHRLTSSQKNAFYNEIGHMVELAAEAVSASSQSKAIAKWRRIFGKRF